MPLTRSVWQDVMGQYKDGLIKGFSSRFRLREGIDLPNTYHCILATPIGSLASYIQTIGRVLRYSAETPDHVLVTDHGGNYLRLGSPNAERDWHRWWKLSEKEVSEWGVERIREQKEPEPIRCPNCEGERLKGPKCPHCGYEHQRSVRNVIQHDGRMVIKEGGLIKPRKEKLKDNTQEDWDKLYWSWRRSKKCQNKTFAQLYAFFCHIHRYWPPKGLKNMPVYDEYWKSKLGDIPRECLRT